ncbi:MAG TPA: thioredoxin domain-containing protein [Anaerolineae bacterium]|nr:thioredoxin domain-containing protein [Anaerolineae bacterium]
MGQVIDYVAAGGAQPQIVPLGDDWHVLGDQQTATAVTVAFVDYASPESGQHAREVLPSLAEQYIDSGQLLYVLHPWSSEAGSPGAQAAIAAECAGEQGKYWEMHDLLFEEQEKWTEAEDPSSLFIDNANSMDLDTARFEECLDLEWAKLRVQAGNVVAALYGVPGAPVFLFNNGQGQQGSPSLEEFQTIIDSIVSP